MAWAIKNPQRCFPGDGLGHQESPTLLPGDGLGHQEFPTPQRCFRVMAWARPGPPPRAVFRSDGGPGCRLVGATSPDLSETNEINETIRGPGHGSGWRVGKNDRTDSRQQESVLSLRLHPDPAVRFFLTTRKNLTDGGKRSP